MSSRAFITTASVVGITSYLAALKKALVFMSKKLLVPSSPAGGKVIAARVRATVELSVAGWAASTESPNPVRRSIL